MSRQKESAPVMSIQDALNNKPLPAPSVPQAGAPAQGKPAKKSGKSEKKERRLLSPQSSVYNLSLKFYEEQLVPHGADKIGGLTAAIHNLDPKKYQVLAIRHDRDTIVTEKFWLPATEKPHWHVLIRCTDRKDRFHVSTMLNKLGILYRVPGADEGLWREHGVETIGNFLGYALYLTHETEDAIRDGKERYDVSEIVSNLTPEEVEAVRDGYIRVGSAKKKVSMEELEALDREAFDIGYDLKCFDTWYASQPFSVRSHCKMKVIRDSYDRGVTFRVEGIPVDGKPAGARRDVTRLCVFIQGPPNCGKTYAVKAALNNIRFLPVSGGGTSKFDNLRPDTEAIVIDDDVCNNLLNMTDNYICRAYRRNSNNPVWAGKYFIVTSNLSFPEWVKQCGIDVWDAYTRGESAQYKAIKSRFYICEVRDVDSTPHLVFTSPSLRGSRDEQAERMNMFNGFAERFDSIIEYYRYIIDKGGLSEDEINFNPSSAFVDDLMNYVKVHDLVSAVDENNEEILAYDVPPQPEPEPLKSETVQFSRNYG